MFKHYVTWQHRENTAVNSGVEKQIIFEDEQIRVIYMPGSSEELVFSFGDLITRAKGLSINAEKSLQKFDFHVIGIMPKLKSWFPERSMHAMLRAIQDWIAPFKMRLAYGGSMGGYAAIKYAKLLGFNRVIALVPQYSIDPDVLLDLRYNMFYQTELNAGMHIQPNDVADNCEYIVVYDPYYAEDRAHYERILACIPALKTLHVPYTGHDAVAVLAGSEMMHDFLRHPFDTVYFYQKMRKVKKNSKFYYRKVIENLLSRHKHALGRILKNNDLALDTQFFDAKQKQAILRELLSHGQVDQQDLMKLGIQVGHFPDEGQRNLLLDCFGHGVVFNVISQKIESYAAHAIALNHKFLIPIEVRGNALLSIQRQDERYFITMNDRQVMKLIREDESLGMGMHPLLMKKYQDYYVMSYKHLNVYSDEWGAHDFSEELFESAKFVTAPENFANLPT